SARACDAHDDASHRLGWLVDGGIGSGAEHAVCSVCAGRGLTTTPNGDPVRRLCAVAAAVVEWADLGASAHLLEAAACRSSDVEAAERSSAACGAELPRSGGGAAVATGDIRGPGRAGVEKGRRCSW